jgi:hypothetical protein
LKEKRPFARRISQSAPCQAASGRSGKWIKFNKNNQVRTVSVGSLMEKKEDYPNEGEKTFCEANLPECTVSGGLWEE